MSEVAIIHENRRPRRNHLDGRTRRAKLAKQWDLRWHQVFGKIVSEIRAANAGVVSEWQQQEAKRAAQLVIECEKLEDAARVGHDIDPKTYTMLVEQQSRGFSQLGLK
jgi:hypothetical protein